MSFLRELQRRNVIRVATVYAVGTWLVLQVGDVLAGILGLPDWTLRFLLMVALLGLPFVLVFSWVYELTPEGIKKESEIESGESVTGDTARKLNVTIIGLLLATVALLLANQFRSPERIAQPAAVAANAVDANSIVVLPFDNFSSDEADRYLANGITESLITMLSGVSELRVAGQASAFSYAEAKKAPVEIGRELGVAYLLRGSVQRAGGNLRITANLIDSRTDDSVWSKKYDKQVGQIFEIQDEIADAVVASLVTNLIGADANSAPERIGTTNMAAYDLYLRAVDAARPGSFEALETSEQLLVQALTLDPDFVEALIELSFVYLRQVDTGARAPDPGLDESAAFAGRALALRPDSVDAAMLQLEANGRAGIERGDFSSIIQFGDEAGAILERAPNQVRAIMSYTGYLIFVGREDEVLELLNRARTIDPRNSKVHQMLGAAYARSGRIAEAREAYRESLELEPSQPNVWTALARLDANGGDYVSYINNYERAMEYDRLDPELPAVLASLMYRMDFVDAGDQYLEQVRDIDPDSLVGRQLELQRAVVSGDTERVRRLAKQMIDDDVPNRQDSFSIAVYFYVASAVSQGELDQAMQFLESRYPQFRDPYRDGIPPKFGSARGGIEMFLLPTYTDEQARTVAEKQRKFFAALRLDIEDTFLPYVYIQMLEQNPEGAAQHYLDKIFPSRILRFRWSFERMFFELPLAQPLLENERVKANVDAWDVALERARARVKGYLDTA